MRIKLVIFVLLLQPIIMKSQNATATLGNITSCAGENVLVPLDVTDFNDVGAMTIYIGYDTNAAEFLSIVNINPSIPGSVSYNAEDGQVNIAYSYTTPFYITGEKLFDLSFSFLGDSTLLPFLPGTEIANSNLEIIPVDTFDGSIANSIQIINQPDNVQSYPDNDVIFRVTSAGNPLYQWQENTGSGFSDLQNNSVYSGVTNDTLTIYDVPLSFNGYTYRCVLTADECIEITDTALLEVALAFPVASIGYTYSCPGNEINVPILVGDFYDVVEFTFNISFDTNSLTYLELVNINPDLLAGEFTITPLSGPAGISIHWEGVPAVSITGGKLFDMKFVYENQDQILAFEDGSEVLNSFLNPINITLNDGILTQYAVPVIEAQPLNDSVTEPNEAHFEVIASGATEYQWIISTDDGNSWTDLSNTAPYYNVNTSLLTITPAVYSMNGDLFACRLGSEHCSLNSGNALLFVDTLTFIENPATFQSLSIYPVPFRDRLEINSTILSGFETIIIYNSKGMAVFSQEITDSQYINKVSLDLSSLPDGLFFLEIRGNQDGIIKNEIKKIVKIN